MKFAILALLGVASAYRMQPGCVAHACREYSPFKRDNDCCGRAHQTFCAPGYVKSVQVTGCERVRSDLVGTCCTPLPKPMHDDNNCVKSACREYSPFKKDNDCCGRAH